MHTQTHFNSDIKSTLHSIVIRKDYTVKVMEYRHKANYILAYSWGIYQMSYMSITLTDL